MSATLSQYKEKQVFRFVLALSIVVFLVVVLLDSKILPRPDPMPAFARYLPALNACINATCSILLIMSLRAIRRKDVARHKQLNLTTFVLSSLFLVSYVLYHWMSEETKFPADNPIRPLYLTILISHIILAALVLPMILMSFWFGLTNQVNRHRKWVRFAFPIWLYVTVTGVIVYLMISPFYSH
jgi:putative membrane protein